MHGASTFLFDPIHDPRSAPAFWRCENCPYVLCRYGPPEQAAEGGWQSRQDAVDHTMHHLVWRGDGLTHRLTVHEAPGREIGRFELMADRDLGLRIACLSRFVATGCGIQRSTLVPTAAQAMRLALMLDILDRLEVSAGPPNSGMRALASDLVFPRIALPQRAIDWKTSSYRRHAQRLVAAAKAMRASGYRDLLRGKMTP